MLVTACLVASGPLRVAGTALQLLRQHCASNIVHHGVWDVAAVFPLASALGFTHLPLLYWQILLSTLLSYVGPTQIIKVWVPAEWWI